MKIKKGNKWKMAFYTKYIYFKYKVITYGLLNTLVSFWRYINKILAKKLDIFVIMYLNDIIIYIKNLGHGYIKLINSMLDILRKHDLYANLEKCCFYKNKVCFLDYIILAQRVKIED